MTAQTVERENYSIGVLLQLWDFDLNEINPMELDNMPGDTIYNWVCDRFTSHKWTANLNDMISYNFRCKYCLRMAKDDEVQRLV